MRLTTLENQDRKINITNLATPEPEHKGVSWRPEDCMTPEIWQRLLGTNEQQILGILAQVFPYRRGELPVSINSFYTDVNKSLAIHAYDHYSEVEKDQEATALMEYLSHTRSLFPEEVDKVIESYPQIVNRAETHTVAREKNSYSPEVYWPDAANFVVATQTGFPIHNFKTSPEILERKLRQLNNSEWWRAGGYYAFLNYILAVWIFDPEAIKLIQPPAQAWPFIENHLSKVENMPISLAGEILSLTLLTATKVTYDRTGLHIQRPDAKPVNTTEEQPPARRQF